MRWYTFFGVSRAWIPVALCVLTFVMIESGVVSANDATRSTPAVDQTRFSARVDHPYIALAMARHRVYKGHERDADSGDTVAVRTVSALLPKTARIAGVPVAVIDVREFEDGVLVEHTLDYYAQRDDGSVWYFGERVDDIEDGKVVGHEGQWLAGRNGARPGLFMPAKPRVGQTFAQERAPGVAEDQSTVVSMGLKIRTPARLFRSCIKTRDYAPIDKRTEFKFYCRGVGLVREQARGTRVDLVSYR